MNVTIDLMNACSGSAPPDTVDFRHWTEAALRAAGSPRANGNPVVSIRIVDETESAELNQAWRHKQGPTNVLSFPCEGFPETDMDLLGDLAICAPLVEQEAAQQQKPALAHWAHLTVHGVLHLNGYDHEQAADAQAMESLEISILASLGYPNPYLQEAAGDE